MTKAVKKILCLRHLGHETFWKILHDAAQLPSHTHTSDILSGKKILLLRVGQTQDDAVFFRQAIADLGGSVLPLQVDADKHTAVSLADSVMTHALGADICVCCGVPQAIVEDFANAIPMAVLNGVSDFARPAALMGDLALMRTFMPAMDTMRIGWVGGATPLAHALIEASMYVPYELFMALPEWGEPNRELLGLALSSGAKIFLTRDVHLAVDEAHFVYVGAGPALPSSGPDAQGSMRVDESVMAIAAPHAHILSGAPWTAACRSPLAVLEGPASLCQQQQDYTLRVAKILLTWFVAEQ